MTGDVGAPPQAMEGGVGVPNRLEGERCQIAVARALAEGMERLHHRGWQHDPRGPHTPQERQHPPGGSSRFAQDRSASGQEEQGASVQERQVDSRHLLDEQAQGNERQVAGMASRHLPAPQGRQQDFETLLPDLHSLGCPRGPGGVDDLGDPLAHRQRELPSRRRGREQLRHVHAHGLLRRGTPTRAPLRQLARARVVDEADLRLVQQAPSLLRREGERHGHLGAAEHEQREVRDDPLGRVRHHDAGRRPPSLLQPVRQHGRGMEEVAVAIVLGRTRVRGHHLYRGSIRLGAEPGEELFDEAHAVTPLPTVDLASSSRDENR